MDGDTPYMAQRRTLHELKAKQDAADGEAAPKASKVSKKKSKKKTGSSSS